MTLNEADLVRRARDGDQDAFEALFREHQGTMYRLAYHFTGSADLAEDVTQDAFVKAWERLAHLRDDGAFGGWMRSILLNQVRDSYRRHKDEQSIEDLAGSAESTETDDPPPDDRLAHEQFRQDVRRAVMSLPEHQRTAVVMHHLEGLEIGDIAARLGLKKGTVLSRLSRGRQMLKKKLAGRTQGWPS